MAYVAQEACSSPLDRALHEDPTCVIGPGLCRPMIN